MLKAINALSNDITLRNAITALQMYHPPKHLTVEHVRPPHNGYGSAFFMKRKLIARPVVKEVWGKPQTVMVNSTSTAFGDLEGIDRGDEFKIVSHLKDCDSCAIAASPTEPARFLFFTDVPEPYVGFDWMGGKSLPVEGGYLCIVIAVSQIPGRGPSLVTAFPCARAYYTSKNATVIHR